MTDVPTINALLKAEQDELARAYCVNALSCLGDAEGRKLLIENLSSQNPAVKAYSADFAGHAKVKEAWDKLVSLLSDENLDVRVRAAQSLILLSR